MGALPGDIFNSFRNLSYLDLSYNNLHSINLDKRRFESLVSLLHLDLSGNDCIYLREDMFEPMISLRYLHLDRNKLGDFFAGEYGENYFRGLKELEKIYIRDNDIRVMPESIFRDQIKSLKILKLGENKLSGWGPNLFKFTKNLQMLDINHNQIGLLREVDLHHLQNLKEMNLKDNPFACTCKLLWFRGWIATTKVRLSNLESFKCSSPYEWQDKPLLEFTEDKIQCTFYSKYVIVGSVSVALFGSLVIVTLVYGYIYYQNEADSFSET